jgi:hypothetical protein
MRCVVATHSWNKAAHLAGLKRVTASLEIDETINPVLVRAALEQSGVVLYFDGEQCRALEIEWMRSFSRKLGFATVKATPCCYGVKPIPFTLTSSKNLTGVLIAFGTWPYG